MGFKLEKCNCLVMDAVAESNNVVLTGVSDTLPKD